MVECSAHPNSIAQKKRQGQSVEERGYMETENNKCMHDDCFTCPYKDCISEIDPRERLEKEKKVDFDCALRE